MKFVLRGTVALILSGFFLWFAFRSVDMEQAAVILARIRWPTLLGYVLLMVVCQLARIFRFDVLVRPFAQVDWRTQMRISSVGLLLIFALPLRLGEFARPLLLKQRAGAPILAGIGAVAVERTMDGLLVTLLFFITTMSLAPALVVPEAVMVGAYVALAIFSSAFVVLLTSLLAGPRFIDRLESLGARVSADFAHKAAGLLRAFVTGLRALPDRRALASFIFLSLLFWVGQAAGYTLVMWGMGLDVPAVAGFIMVAVIVLGIMIPGGPGNLGTFQAAIVWGLAIFSLDETTAAAFGLVVYPLTAAVTFAFGVPYLASENLGKLMSALWRREDGASAERDTPVDRPTADGLPS